uniref:Uncharacterized protein n=1 Tax=viral metagenome TaxID=1070528 RepID=A0A6C0JWF5_9ZZZZ
MTCTNPQDVSKNIQDTLNNSIQDTLQQMSGQSTQGMDAIYTNLLNQMTCDSDCQKRKKIDALKQSWLDAKTNEQTAPSKTFETHKEYLIANEGQLGYEHSMLQKYSKIAADAKNKAIQEHTSTEEELQTLIRDYDSELISLNKLREMLNIRLRENKQLKQSIDEDIAAVETNDRRVVYEDWAKDDIQSIYTLLKWIYICLIFVFIYTSGFITNSGWKHKREWFVLIGIILIPFIIYYIAIVLIYLYNRLLWYSDNKVPKDVYIQQADNVKHAKIY